MRVPQRYYNWRRGSWISLTSTELLMATQHGRLREFHPETDRITSYLERASLYFAANKFPGPKQVAVLFSSIGVPTFALLSDLFGPDKPSSKTFKQISEALVNHYEPQRVIIAERFYFHRKGPGCWRVDCRL